MIPINFRPDRKILAEFSEFWLFFIGMVACPLAYLRGRPVLAAACWVAAVLVRLIGATRPAWLRPLFVGMTVATYPIGWAVSNLTLVLLYYGAFTPIALVFRLIGRDALTRTLDRSAPTYWEPYKPDRGLPGYLRPF